MQSHRGLTKLAGQAEFCRHSHARQRSDRFGRLLGSLPPIYVDPDTMRAVGAPGGPMDGGTGNTRTLSVPVGMVFVAQFVDHDTTLDVSSSFDRVNAAEEIGNARTPTLDLDAVYGGGKEAAPYPLKASASFAGVKLLTSVAALIGDPRNYGKRIKGQIHLAMIRAHNKMLDRIASRPGAPAGHAVLDAARQEVMWHYQWSIVHDFLVIKCGAGVVNRILSEGRKHYTASEPFIPVEFSVAGFQFGHPIVPQEVQTQKRKPAQALLGPDLGAAFTPVPNGAAVADMHEIFDTHAGHMVERAQRMDAKLARRLLDLPFIASGKTYFATRNMLRGQSFLLPAGETFARSVCRPEKEIEQVSAAVAAATGGALSAGVPLWLYFPTEAMVIGREAANGSCEPAEGFGPAAGALLVAETIIGLIELDERSWLATDRSCSPDRQATDAERLDGIGNILAWTQTGLA